MPTSNCKKCQQAFAYDVDLGLNVKFYPLEATRHHVRASRVMPCCPACGVECERQQERFATITMHKIMPTLVVVRKSVKQAAQLLEPQVECGECGVVTTPAHADFCDAASGEPMAASYWLCHRCQQN